jgi:hypothetical protein
LGLSREPGRSRLESSHTAAGNLAADRTLAPDAARAAGHAAWRDLAADRHAASLSRPRFATNESRCARSGAAAAKPRRPIAPDRAAVRFPVAPDRGCLLVHRVDSWRRLPLHHDCAGAAAVAPDRPRRQSSDRAADRPGRDPAPIKAATLEFFISSE